MLGTDRSFGKHRVEFFDGLTEREVHDLTTNPNLRTLQTARPVSPQTWELLNRSLFATRPDVELRVYGFYSSTCDLSFVKGMTNVRRFAADCLMRAVGIEHLAALEYLEELSIGVFNLDSFDFLTALPPGIKSLFLGATKSKKPRLDGLRQFRSLRTLYIEGQQRGIEVIAELHDLEDITLKSVTIPGVECVALLPRLWSLDIKLGGIQDLSAIANKESIKYLELWQIKGLADISVISSLSGLQYLFLQSLRHVTSIPDLSRLNKLRKIVLENMKGLTDVSGIGTAPVLEEFLHVSAQGFLPKQYWELLNKPSLRQAHIGFCSQRKNEQFESLVRQSGRSQYQRTEFVFQ